MTNQLFVWKMFVVQQDVFFVHQHYDNFSFTKKRLFVSSVGPFGAGISQLVYIWLKLGTYQIKFFDKFFINTLSNFVMLCKKRLNISSLFKVQTLNFLVSQVTTVRNTCLSLTIFLKRFAIQKHLLIMPPLDVIAG